MVIRSDNGPQYTAEEYKRFTKEWGIQHVTTSPYHPQANGLAEKSVQIIKSLLNQSKANNQDPYLSLLEYRNTTVDNVSSPAQLLMGRKLRATLLVTASQLKQKSSPQSEKTRWKEVPTNPQTSVKYQVRNDHYNATKHKVKPALEEKGMEWYRTKIYIQQATPTEEGTDVGGDVQPEHEVTQNEDQQQESLTEEEDDVAGERQ
eukprot:Em0005g344a